MPRRSAIRKSVGSRAYIGAPRIQTGWRRAIRRKFSRGAWRRACTPGWKRIEKEFEESLRKQWPIYARNMTADNIISVHLTTPRGILATHPDMIEGGYPAGSNLASQIGRFRPIPDLAGYRTLLPNLYTCSSNVHSGSGIGRGSSYNCWRQIAADLAIDPDAEHRRPDTGLAGVSPAEIGG
jgi:phytoene dehydrogenase-like protein